MTMALGLVSWLVLLIPGRCVAAIIGALACLGRTYKTGNHDCANVEACVCLRIAPVRDLRGIVGGERWLVGSKVDSLSILGRATTLCSPECRAVHVQRITTLVVNAHAFGTWASLRTMMASALISPGVLSNL
jgi:hypothetical protein